MKLNSSKMIYQICIRNNQKLPKINLLLHKKTVPKLVHLFVSNTATDNISRQTDIGVKVILGCFASEVKNRML